MGSPSGSASSGYWLQPAFCHSGGVFGSQETLLTLVACPGSGGKVGSRASGTGWDQSCCPELVTDLRVHLLQ